MLGVKKLLIALGASGCRMLGSLNSWNVPRIEKTPAIVSAGRKAGSLMLLAIRHWPAPSTAAASYSSAGTTRVQRRARRAPNSHGLDSQGRGGRDDGERVSSRERAAGRRAKGRGAEGDSGGEPDRDGRRGEGHRPNHREVSKRPAQLGR